MLQRLILHILYANEQIKSERHTEDMWAVVGRQEMLQRKRQKSTPSHGRKEKAETVNGPCFMVLLTLKEQVEWNMYNTGQVSVLLQCRSWIILPQASQLGKLMLDREWVVCQMAWHWFSVAFLFLCSLPLLSDPGNAAFSCTLGPHHIDLHQTAVSIKIMSMI